MKTYKTIAILAAVTACSAVTSRAFNILTTESSTVYLGANNTDPVTIESWVVDDTSSGDGTNGADLTFVYQIHNGSGGFIGPVYLADFGNNTIYSLALADNNNNYDNFFSMYNGTLLTGAITPTSFNGQNAAGSEITGTNEEAKFDYNEPGNGYNSPLPNGAYSDLLVVNTNIASLTGYVTNGTATVFAGPEYSGTGIVDDLFSANVNILAPQGLPPAVPDAASTVSLFCIELGALAGLRRHLIRA